MGAAPEVRLVIKHTFLEFVEEGASLGKPFRQRAFTDSALANEGRGSRQHPLNGDADNSASPQELPPHHLCCEASASSSSGYNSGSFRVNRGATEEVKAVLGMTPHARVEAPSFASEGERRPPGGPPGSGNRAVRRPQAEDAAGTRNAAVGAPVLQAAAPAPPPRGPTWTVPMHARPLASGACRGAESAVQAPAAVKARPAQRGSGRAGEPAEPQARPDAEGWSLELEQPTPGPHVACGAVPK